MATFRFALIHGLKLGDETLRKVVMKDHLTALEIAEASEASERLVMVPIDNDEKEPSFVISPTRMAMESLRRQIVSIGEVDGPISMAMLGKLHEDDIARLHKAADTILKLRVSKEVARRGRTESARESV